MNDAINAGAEIVIVTNGEAGIAAKVIRRDCTGRVLVEYQEGGPTLEYPFNVKPGEREWIGPYGYTTRALRPEPSAADALSRREAVIHALKDTLRITMIEEFGELISARITEENMASTADAILALPCADEAAIRADEREKCAKIVDASAREAIDQINHNNAYYERSGSRDTGANDACRSHKITAEQIASAIRNGGKQP